MTWLTYRETDRVVDQHSTEQLRRSAKAMGMAVVERLSLLDVSFGRVVARIVAGDRHSARPSFSATEQHFIRGYVALGVRGDTLHSDSAASLQGLAFTSELRKHLATRRSLLVPFQRGDTIALAHVSLADANGESVLIATRVNRSDIFGGEHTRGWQEPGMDFCVLAQRQPMWCSDPNELHGWIEPRANGALVWRLARRDRAVPAVSWAGFSTRTPPGVSMEIVVFGVSATRTTAAFTRSVVILATASLVLVFLASHVLLRRALRPLSELTLATDRIAAQEYEARVSVNSSDEFGTLAHAFNVMSARIHSHVTTLSATAAITREALELDDVALLTRRLASAVRAVLPGVCGLSIVARATGGTWLRRSAVGADQDWIDDTIALRDNEIRELRQGRTIIARFGGHEPRTYLRAPTPSIAWEAKAVIIPMLVHGEVVGAIAELHPVDADVVAASDGLCAVADQVALAVNRVRLVGRLEQFNHGTLLALSRAVDANSHWTAGHSARVTHGALQVGKRMGLGSDDLDALYRGGLIHDLGKLAVPAHILDKPSSLTPEETRIMRAHPEQGARILAPLDAYEPIVPIVLHHHEKFNGTGYPAGLRGNGIPFLARVLAVADVYDSLVSARPYRAPWSPDQASAYIRDEAGAHFDPQVVAAFAEIEPALRRWYARWDHAAEPETLTEALYS